MYHSLGMYSSEERYYRGCRCLRLIIAASLRDEREMAVRPVVGSYAVALWWGLKDGEVVKRGPALPVENDTQSFRRTK